MEERERGERERVRECFNPVFSPPLHNAPLYRSPVIAIPPPLSPPPARVQRRLSRRQWSGVSPPPHPRTPPFAILMHEDTLPLNPREEQHPDYNEEI